MRKAHMLYGPPGTGKTTELLNRLQAYIGVGVDRNEISYLSFTKSAAEEALRRMELKRSEKICTIHAMVYRLLHISKEQVVDTEKMQELANKTGIQISGATADSERELTLGDEFLSIQQFAVASQQDPNHAYQSSHGPGSAQLFKYFCESYGSWKRSNGFLDFNDMLLRYASGQGPELKARVMFIDEAQDLSRLQWTVIERLISSVEEVHIGGDDDQAIFEWSGADPNGMATFERSHSAKRTVLAQSWRLPRAVHTLGNRVISRVRQRVFKEYAPRPEEGKIIRHGHVWGLGKIGDEGSTLVLYRNHSNRRDLENYLTTNAVPYETMAGWTSPLQGKYGWAIRTFRTLKSGGDVAANSLEAMKRVLTSRGREVMRGGLPALLAAFPTWEHAIEVPMAIRDYLRRVDMDAPVRVRLGSIHSAKGREADRVILLTAMGRRTSEAAVHNPDAEARVWYVGVTRSKMQLDIVEGAGGYSI